MFATRRPFFKLHRAMSTTPPAPLLLKPAQVTRLVPQSIALIDASWVMPNSPRRPKEEFAAVRIPRARFLDIDDVARRTENGEKLGLSHMMPEPEVFAQACRRPSPYAFR